MRFASDQLFFCAVFLDAIKIDVSSWASLIINSMSSLLNKSNTSAKSNQNSDSSASSITILNFTTKAALVELEGLISLIPFWGGTIKNLTRYARFTN